MMDGERGRETYLFPLSSSFDHFCTLILANFLEHSLYTFEHF
jgi:hypothetical protein